MPLRRWALREHLHASVAGACLAATSVQCCVLAAAPFPESSSGYCTPQVPKSQKKKQKGKSLSGQQLGFSSGVNYEALERINGLRRRPACRAIL